MKERVENVKVYATAMADKYLFARQKLAIMEPLLGEDITKLFDKVIKPVATIAPFSI